jgi:hypothetical protein
MDKLYDQLLGLDSDEGIRIVNSKSEKKIYINRNLLGIYNVLIRIKNENTDNKNIAKNNHNDVSGGDYLEEIHNFDNPKHVLEFLIQNTDEPSIWLY